MIEGMKKSGQVLASVADPDGRDLLEICRLLRSFDTPTVSNAVEALNVRDRTEGYASSEIRCCFPELEPLVGYAVTCTVDSTTSGANPPSRLGELIDILGAAVRPTVVVGEYVGSNASRGCFVGDMMATLFRRLGAVGVITDAPNRDLGSIQLRAPGFQVFGSGSVASHGNSRILDVSIPVVVGGLRILPGDLLHADLSGVITVPTDLAHEVAKEAQRIRENEEALAALLSDPLVSLGELRSRFSIRSGRA
jgi:4-hydroxy-4-methyl-2-oxoglutarate aldolase